MDAVKDQLSLSLPVCVTTPSDTSCLEEIEELYCDNATGPCICFQSQNITACAQTRCDDASASRTIEVLGDVCRSFGVNVPTTSQNDSGGLSLRARLGLGLSLGLGLTFIAGLIFALLLIRRRRRNELRGSKLTGAPESGEPPIEPTEMTHIVTDSVAEKRLPSLRPSDEDKFVLVNKEHSLALPPRIPNESRPKVLELGGQRAHKEEFELDGTSSCTAVSGSKERPAELGGSG